MNQEAPKAKSKPITSSESLHILEIRRQSHSSESNPSPTLLNEYDSSIVKRQRDSQVQEEQKQRDSQDLLFCEDPEYFEKPSNLLLDIQGLTSSVSNQTRHSANDVLVSPFNTDKTPATRACREDSDSIIINKVAMFPDNYQDDHGSNFLNPFDQKAQKKMLYVDTRESSVKKCRLMHSTTQPLVQKRFQLSLEKAEDLGELEQRVNSFFDSEGVYMQHVGEYIREQNAGVFRGITKLSSMKLDITKSPLRRNRANTICI